MMRFPTLLLVLALSTPAFVACGDGESPVAKLRLEDLVRFAGRYDGERVTSAGIVRSHSDPEHYWIEDDELHRVEVRPPSAVAAHLGERVRIVGRFYYSRKQGRTIEVERIAVLGR